MKKIFNWIIRDLKDLLIYWFKLKKKEKDIQIRISNFENTILKLNEIKSVFRNSDFIFWKIIDLFYIILKVIKNSIFEIWLIYILVFQIVKTVNIK